MATATQRADDDQRARRPRRRRMTAVERGVERDERAQEVGREGRPLGQEVERRWAWPAADSQPPVITRRAISPSGSGDQEDGVDPPARLDGAPALAGDEEVVEQDAAGAAPPPPLPWWRAARRNRPRAASRRHRGPPARTLAARRRLARPNSATSALERLATYATVSAAIGLAAKRQAPSRATRSGSGRPRRRAIHWNSDEEERGVAAWMRTFTRWYDQGFSPADGVVEGPGPGEQRPRGLVTEDAPPRREVTDRRVAEDQLPVVVDEVAGDGGRIDEEGDQRPRGAESAGHAVSAPVPAAARRPSRLAHARLNTSPYTDSSAGSLVPGELAARELRHRTCLFACPFAIVEPGANGRHQRARVVGRDHAASRAREPLPAAVTSGHDRRRPRQSRLERNEAEGLTHGRMHDEVRARVLRGQRVAGEDAAGGHAGVHLVEGVPEPLTEAADEVQVHRGKGGQHRGQDARALLRTVRPHEEETRARVRRSGRRDAARLDAVRDHPGRPRQVARLAVAEGEEDVRLPNDSISEQAVEDRLGARELAVGRERPVRHQQPGPARRAAGLRRHEGKPVAMAVQVREVERPQLPAQEVAQPPRPRHQPGPQEVRPAKTPDADTVAALFEGRVRLEQGRGHRHRVPAARQGAAEGRRRTRHAAVGPGRLVERSDVEDPQRSPMIDRR